MSPIVFDHLNYDPWRNRQHLCVAVFCPCVAVCCRVLQCVAVCHNVIQYVEVCSVLLGPASTVLQGVAVCCRRNGLHPKMVYTALM